MPDQTLTTGADPVLRWSRETPHAIAVMENNVSYSYSALARNLTQAAKMLAMAGLCPGMIVGIECEVRYLHLVLILACEVLGAAHVMMEPSDLTSDSALLPHCDLLCVQTNNDHLSKHARVIQLSLEFVHEMLRQSVDDNDLEILARAYRASDIVRIGKTSGTTGHPKFMGYARDALRSAVEFVPYLLKFDETRQNFIAFYSFIMMRTYSDTISAFRFGATVIYSMGWEIAASIRKLPACHTFLLVGAAADLLSSEQFRDGRLDSCSLCVGGGFGPNTLRARLRQSVTTDLQIAYSTNETRDITTDDGDGPGTVLPDVSVRIVDDSGHEMEPGQSGRVLVRTPRMASGYLWNDTETQAHFADGWFLTSDIGCMPQADKLTLLGRADDMINLGGLTFAPDPIEEQIRAIDGVIDAVLIGSQNAAGSGELHVFIEQSDLALDRTMEPRITPLLIGRVTAYHIHYVDQIPRTSTGKIQRSLLRQSLCG
jgi:acyl-coenzyme A synthetase/AMP-(fatty) acid ligase